MRIVEAQVEQRCTICNGNAGRFNHDGEHWLCHYRKKHGMATPPMMRCSHCSGRGYIARSIYGPMMDFGMGPAKIKKAIDAWAPKCVYCDGTGVLNV